MEVFHRRLSEDGTILLPATAMIIDENSFSEYLLDHHMSFFGEGSDKCKQLITPPMQAFVNLSYHVGYLGILSFLRYLQGNSPAWFTVSPFIPRNSTLIPKNDYIII
jgi:hypothetical protein